MFSTGQSDPVDQCAAFSGVSSNVAVIVPHPALLDGCWHRMSHNIEQLVSQPHVRLVGEIDGFWPVYRRVANTVKPKGNWVPNAHFVALMRQHGISTISSHDQDFRTFEGGITVRDPFVG